MSHSVLLPIPLSLSLYSSAFPVSQIPMGSSDSFPDNLSCCTLSAWPKEAVCLHCPYYSSLCSTQVQIVIISSDLYCLWVMLAPHQRTFWQIFVLFRSSRQFWGVPQHWGLSKQLISQESEWNIDGILEEARDSHWEWAEQKRHHPDLEIKLNFQLSSMHCKMYSPCWFCLLSHELCTFVSLFFCF